MVATVAAPQTGPALTRSQQAARRMDEDTRQVISRYGQCLVRRKPAEASAFVLASRNSSELEDRPFGEPRQSPCLSISGWDRVWSAHFPAGTLRYTLAEALVAREFSKPKPSLSDVPPLDHPKVVAADFQLKSGMRPSRRRDEWLAQARKAAIVGAFMSSYGECVVRSDPIGSHQLLMTEVTTAPEALAFGKLKPSLASCLPNGQKLAFNKAGIRGAIAVNYYRLAKARSVQSGFSPAGVTR
jgi:hypothetical protein